MSDGSVTAFPGGPESVPVPESTPALPDWPDGTVLPDEMIAQLRDTLGALDALLREP
jgi:hypothetical protein